MELGNLAGADIAIDKGLADLEITGISANSRELGKGFLFAALAGTRVDGAQFAEDAVRNGASAILANTNASIDIDNVPVLRADEPRLVLAKFAARFYDRQPETIAAVTGTAGKTSVAEFLRQIWEREGRTAASIGTTGISSPGLNLDASLTTPDPVRLHSLLAELADEGVTHASMEASSHGLDQFRLHGVRLAAGAFTNLGRDHMDYHPDVEDYFRAKMRLFCDLLPKGSPAVIFADDAWSQRAEQAAMTAGLDVLTVGRTGSFLSLKRVEHERFRQIAEINHDDQIYRVEFPLAGDFQIANALVAAGLAIATGSEPKRVLHALEGLKGASGRLELAGKTKDGAPVYVDYAHKPEAMENVLTSLKPFTTGKLVILFGCGGDRDPGKRPIMGEIASRLADRVIVTDDNPRSEDPASIRAQIMAAAPDATEIGDRRKAIEMAIGELSTGDALIVAGKGHEHGQTVGSKTLPFSDMDVVCEVLGLQSAEQDA